MEKVRRMLGKIFPWIAMSGLFLAAWSVMAQPAPQSSDSSWKDGLRWERAAIADAAEAAGWKWSWTR